MPGRTKKPSKIVLERGAKRHEIHPRAWADILLILQDYGWNPEQPMSINYLVSDIDVSDADAHGLLIAGDNLLAMALSRGTSIDPALGPTPFLIRYGRSLEVNVGMVFEFVNFLKGGGFRICR